MIIVEMSSKQQPVSDGLTERTLNNIDLIEDAVQLRFHR